MSTFLGHTTVRKGRETYFAELTGTKVALDTLLGQHIVAVLTEDEVAYTPTVAYIMDGHITVFFNDTPSAVFYTPTELGY